MKNNSMDNSKFILASANFRKQHQFEQKIHASADISKSRPIISVIILALIILCCIFAEHIMNHDPSVFYTQNLNQSPNSEFYFGTDTLGRDIFSIIWYGGRISLFIGFLGTIILSTIGIIYGCISGLAPKWLDNLMMRFAELLSSVPAILILIFLTSMIKTPTVFSLAIFIGLVNWMPIARMVRTEVLNLKNVEFLWAGKLMGASFWHILSKYLVPNFWSTIMFMVISSISTCIMNEAVLSFLGLGLPVDIVSWGSMLSLSNRALLSNSWWVILFPGLFIIVTLLCITNIGFYLKSVTSHKHSNL